MKSKMQPPVTFEPDALRHDDAFAGLAPIKISVSGRLLRQIADALQVPQSVLYSAAGTDTSTIETITALHNPDTDAGCDPNIDRNLECVTLLQAFTQIRDAKTRSGLLSLVQAAADREEADPAFR